MTMTDQSTTSSISNPSGPEPRRNVMAQLMAGVIGAFVGIVPFVSGLLFFLDPITRKKSDVSGGEGEFIPTGVSVDSLPADGTPMMVKIVADKVDAWNKFVDVPIGTVWVSKHEGQIKCFNTVCPHLGCSVDYRPSGNDFFCPCHTSAFNLDGTKKNQIPPRDMDGLNVRVADGKLEVEYKNFHAGQAEKTEV